MKDWQIKAIVMMGKIRGHKFTECPRCGSQAICIPKNISTGLIQGVSAAVRQPMGLIGSNVTQTVTDKIAHKVSGGYWCVCYKCDHQFERKKV